MIQGARRAMTIVALLAVAIGPAHAQRLEIAMQPANCALADQAFDNPFSDATGWTMRRYQWHGFYAALSLTAAYVIHRATGLPPWLSATVASVGIGLVPHIRGGLIRRDYPIDPADWAFDAWNRSTPLLWVLGTRSADSAHRTRAALSAAAIYAGGYAALACHASP
jgi:hypothetical protein